jgi:hypothetical protein
MSDTQHGRRRRVSLARLDETVVENALRQRDAESAELEADVAKWRTRAHTLAGVLERIANDPTSKREDVQAIVNTTLGRMDWR